MKYFSSIFCTFLILLSLGFAKDVELGKEEQISIIYNSQVYDLNDNPAHQDPNQSREQIDLIFEDFETTAGDWDASDGWVTNTTEYHSEVTSYHSADYLPTDDNGDPTYKSWDLFSPLYTLPELGDGETMHFDFWLNLDLPGAECDGDSFLDDYYGVSILDIESLAWHTSDYNSTDGPSWFCGFEDIGNGSPGYLDAWVQYLDTPSFTVADGATVSADMWWGLEDPAGAEVAGTCTDGWDQANVQISVDGGATFSMLESGDYPYDFGCGYGMVYNGLDCLVSGDCPGWGGYSPGLSGWNNVSFDLASFAGQDAIVRFAFYSDPAYSSMDEPTATGFQVDNIVVSDGAFSDTADDEAAMAISGAVWVDQFYDYWDDGSTYDPRPGSNGWEQYVPGLPFNGNVFMDISDFAGKDVIFRFQTRLGELTGLCGEGEGMFVDDFRVYKESGGSYPTPSGLTAESGDSEVTLSWNDMNGAGTDDFIYDNDPATWGGIQMSTTGSTAWAGERIDLVGASTINTVSVHLGPNTAGATTTLAVFGMLGSLFNNEPLYTQEITLGEGWNDFDLGLDMNNGYIVATLFTNVENEDMVDGVFAPLDDSATPSTNSMVLFSGGGWDLWSVAGATVGDGEWGVRANISYSGAGVTYNLYRDGDPSAVANGLTAASHTDTGLENNQEYYYQVTATYGDGTESDYSNVVYVTPFSNTVHEVANDDGTAEAGVNYGSGNAMAVKYTACSNGELLNRFKWYQTLEAGAFYIKIYADDGGLPGEETFSRVVAGGLVEGWNEFDLLGDALVLSGDFWLGIREFSSTRPIGLDTSSNAGASQENSSGDWTAVEGNIMIRALLDEASCSGEPECTPGDTNDDGGIDVLDVVAVVNYIIGNSDEVDCADMNGDGGVDVLDVVAMVNLIIN
jgi:hypothetical protein